MHLCLFYPEEAGAFLQGDFQVWFKPTPFDPKKGGTFGDFKSEMLPVSFHHSFQKSDPSTSLVVSGCFFLSRVSPPSPLVSCHCTAETEREAEHQGLSTHSRRAVCKRCAARHLPSPTSWGIAPAILLVVTCRVRLKPGVTFKPRFLDRWSVLCSQLPSL